MTRVLSIAVMCVPMFAYISEGVNVKKNGGKSIKNNKENTLNNKEGKDNLGKKGEKGDKAKTGKEKRAPKLRDLLGPRGRLDGRPKNPK